MKKLGKDVKAIDKDAMEEYVHKSGGQIIANKGATFYAVATSVCELCSRPASAQPFNRNSFINEDDTWRVWYRPCMS